MNDELKRLRATIRQYKKNEQRLAQNIFSFHQRENIFPNHDWSAFSCSIFAQEKYLLAKQMTLIELEKVLTDTSFFRRIFKIIATVGLTFLPAKYKTILNALI